jgi:hypothetical protein
MSIKTVIDRPQALEDAEMARFSGGRYSGAVFMYTIQPGETLSILAHRFGTTVRVLRELNSITDAAQAKAGASIMIPQR